MRTIFAGAALLSLTLIQGLVYAAGCPNSDAMIAEVSIDHLKTWEDLHALFEKYPGCNDGAIAEGYTDFVARALAGQWSHVDQLQALIARDPPFRDFVLRHIDATADCKDLSAAVANARQRCPNGAQELCTAIRTAAEKAILTP